MAGTESGPQWSSGASWDVALEFSLVPRRAMVFNDNMVAQAVAAPLRQEEEEAERSGGWLAAGAKDVYQALPLCVLTPICLSSENNFSF